MSAEIPATISVTVNDKGASAALDTIKRSVTQLGKESRDQGDTAEQAFRKQEAAAKRFGKELTNARLETLLLNKAGSERAELKAAFLGITDGPAMAQIAALKALEAQQLSTNKTMAAAGPIIYNVGNTAKQTTAAMRQVPMQLTDIVVSLQGGQSAMQVLLQQGGQLKDIFGGIGPAAKALGGYVLSLVNPFTIGIAAAGVYGYALFSAAKQTQEYAKAVILSGSAAGVTANQLQDMGAKMSATAGIGAGAASEALSLFARNGNIAADNLERFALIAVNNQRLTGTAVGDTVKMFAELGKDPVAASIKLNEETGFLTVELYQQIKALEAQGRATEAGVVAQNAAAKATEENLAALQKNLLPVQIWYQEAANAAKLFWANATGQGDQMADLRKSIAVREGFVKNNVTGVIPTDDKTLNSLKEKLKYFEHIEASDRDYAKFKADEQKRLDATLVWEKGANKFKSDAIKLNEAQTKSIIEGTLAKASDAEILARHNALQEEYNKKQKTGPRADSGESKRLTDAKADVKAFNDMNDLRRKSTEDAAKVIEKADLAQAEAHGKYVSSLAAGLDKIRADTLAQEDSTAKLGLNKEAIAALDTIRLESQATTLELMAIKTLDKNLDEAQYNLYKQQAEALRDLALAKRGGAKKAADLDAQKEAEKLSEDAAKTLHNDFKGALSAAFRDSKDPIGAFGDALANTIFTRASTAIAEALAKAFIDSSVAKGFMALFGFEKGGAFPTPFANGGAFTNSIVSQPTLFKFASGGSFKPGVMGEAGPEAIMPLSRGPDGKLGVKSSGGQQTVNVTYNMTVGDVASASMVRQAIAGSERRIAAGIGRSMAYGGAMS